MSQINDVNQSQISDDGNMKKYVKICLHNNRFRIFRRVAEHLSMKIVNENADWNVLCSESSIPTIILKSMKRYQRVNHFPGCGELSRKDSLARNLKRMLNRFPREYSIFPPTWCLPFGYRDAVNYAKRKKCIFIVKPAAGSSGKGIVITKNLEPYAKKEDYICQKYIENPFLIFNTKFDLRLYVLVTCVNPLVIYIYHEGLVRFATCRYQGAQQSNTFDDTFMHLTNYSVNKSSLDYDEDTCRKSIAWFNNYLDAYSYNKKEIWRNIDDCIIKTIIAVVPVLRRSYKIHFSSHNLFSACFEVFGFDIILSRVLKPYVLEVNHSPSFHTDAAIDLDVKGNLLRDLFKMLNLGAYNKHKIIEEDRKIIASRLTKINYKKPDLVKNQQILEANFCRQLEFEAKNSGGFRLIFPLLSKEQPKYDMYLEAAESLPTVYESTVASREREIAQQEFRDLLLANAMKKNPFVKLNLQNEKDLLTIDTLKPLPINERDERLRLAEMRRRTFLVEKKLIRKNIYQHFKQIGLLSASDIKQFGGEWGVSSHCYPNSFMPRF